MKPKRLSPIGSLHQYHGVACGCTERQIELVYSPLDDSGGSRFSPRWGRQHTILPNFPKNCMKLNQFGPPGERAYPKFYYVDPPLDEALLRFKQK